MKTPEELTTHLQNALGDNLISVVLYGSAAAGDRTEKYSDFNTLVIVKDIGLPVLKSAMPVVKILSLYESLTGIMQLVVINIGPLKLSNSSPCFHQLPP